MCLVCRGRGGRKEGREEWEGGEERGGEGEGRREEKREEKGGEGRNQLKANLRQCAIWHSKEESEFPYEEVKEN